MKLAICSGNDIQITKSEFFRLISDLLGRLDYTELYNAYSGVIRKTQVEPRILFEIVICAYIMGVYSSRKIKQLCREHVQFLLILDGHEPPDHTTIARFRSGKKTGLAIMHLFEQFIRLLESMGEIDYETVYVDGTKLESKANRYTYVWRNNLVRELKKLKEKVKKQLPDNGGYTTLNKTKEYIAQLDKEIAEGNLGAEYKRGRRKPSIVRLRDDLQALVERWTSYEAKLNIMGEGRNSYSKTDHDATFMRMKDDHMRRGQLRPAYNVQFAVNSEYITGIGVFSNRTDYATLPVLLDAMHTTYGKRYTNVVTDSGYESLANYRYLAGHGQLAYIKPSNYKSKKTRKYKAQIGRAENMEYNEADDCFICKLGRVLRRTGTTQEDCDDGNPREVAHYRCEDCGDCPYRAACCKAKDTQKPKELEVCWELVRLRQQSLERIMTKEGTLLRVNRSIQSEGSFGQLKHNRGFRRFLTSGGVKVTTEVCLLVLSQDILKYIRKCNKNKCQTHFLYPETLKNT